MQIMKTWNVTAARGIDNLEEMLNAVEKSGKTIFAVDFIGRFENEGGIDSDKPIYSIIAYSEEEDEQSL